MALIVTHACPLRFPSRDVWRAAGAYGALHHIHSGTESCTLEDGGRMRVLVTATGAILWERLLAFDEEGMTLRYQIIDAKALENCPYGRGYVGELRIAQEGAHNSVFHYQGAFDPLPGYDEEQSRASVKAFAQDCADGIARYLHNRSAA